MSDSTYMHESCHTHMKTLSLTHAHTLSRTHAHTHTRTHAHTHTRATFRANASCHTQKSHVTRMHETNESRHT